jgi:hypothetical protein
MNGGKAGMRAILKSTWASTSVIGSTSYPPSLRVNFTWTLISNVVYATCQWGTMVTLVKSRSSEMVGQFAFRLAITMPIILFVWLALQFVQATNARWVYRFGDYLCLWLAARRLLFHRNSDCQNRQEKL